MFEQLNNDHIRAALDELTACLGVKEDIPFHNLIILLRRNETEKCVQEIATQLGLPIRIELSFVPKEFKPGCTDGFRTSEMARTDWTGRGIEAIIAQVSIPQYLPMFGSSGLQGYPIRVRVSENCNAHPATFVAIMAHEISHILLASLLHPQKDSELYTDLVPILLGFRSIVRRGRKHIDTTTSDDTITTQTTTYGYLTDSQFTFAYSHITAILRCHQRERKALIKSMKQVHRRHKKAARRLATFHDYIRYIDRHPPEKMSVDHAQRVVSLHAHNYSQEWESHITESKTLMARAKSFAIPLTHYTNSAIDHIRTHAASVRLTNDHLIQVTDEITKDLKILRRYVGFIYRLRRALWL